MTILVVFGITMNSDPNYFNVEHGTLVHGDNGDCIYFADDKKYDVEKDKTLLPLVNEETRIPVIQHNTGAENHVSQLNWLKGSGKYTPTNVGNFSHGAGKTTFDTIRHLFNSLSDQDAIHKNQVSSFVQQYSNRAILKYMDNCAAWNTLFLVSGLSEHEENMTKCSGMLPSEVLNILDLNNLKESQWQNALEKQAAFFCQVN